MADEVTADQQADAQPDPSRRSTSGEIARAIDLGWRVASLHTLRPTTMQPLGAVDRGLLPNRRSLLTPDRLELEISAMAGVAARVGVEISDFELRTLLGLAEGAHDSHAAEREFRDCVGARHIAFVKRLWAAGEPMGKAYELGNFLSDTRNRLMVFLDANDTLRVEPNVVREELLELFGSQRVARMTLLLDDLQARIDPVAVHAVTHHLAEWSDYVAGTCLASVDDGDLAAGVLTVRRQTIVWRQMLTGDKEPEAWIDATKRAKVRTKVVNELWGRYLKPFDRFGRVGSSVVGLLLIAALIALCGAGVWLYGAHGDTFKTLAVSMLALAGAVGVTRATMLGALRQGLSTWGDLVWNRALAEVICHETSLVREFCPPDGAQRTNSTSTRSPASSDSRSSGTKA